MSACRLDMLSSVCLSCSYLLRGLIPWMLVKYILVVREGFGVVIMLPMNSLSESCAVNGRCRYWVGVGWLWHSDVVDEGVCWLRICWFDC